MISYTKYGNTNDVTVVEMGSGDVLMVGSLKSSNGEVVLALKSSKTPLLPIGVKHNSNFKDFDEMQPEVVFVFNNVESIDSVISMLQDCKDEMLSTSAC